MGEISGQIGTFEAIALWITLGYTVFVLVATGGEYALEEADSHPRGNLPHEELAFTRTAGGAIGTLLVILFGLESMDAWVNAISLGPSGGVPVGSSGSSVMLWVIIAITPAEALSRGLDKLVVRYVWTGDLWKGAWGGEAGWGQPSAQG